MNNNQLIEHLFSTLGDLFGQKPNTGGSSSAVNAENIADTGDEITFSCENYSIVTYKNRSQYDEAKGIEENILQLLSYHKSTCPTRDENNSLPESMVQVKRQFDASGFYNGFHKISFGRYMDSRVEYFMTFDIDRKIPLVIHLLEPNFSENEINFIKSVYDFKLTGRIVIERNRLKIKSINGSLNNQMNSNRLACYRKCVSSFLRSNTCAFKSEIFVLPDGILERTINIHKNHK